MIDPQGTAASSITLGDAFAAFLGTLRPEQRSVHERYVRHYVQTVGEEQPTGTITSARVELYAEANIRPTDPLADERVAALKAWFQYLKKRNHTPQNFGTVIRVRRAGRPAIPAVAVRSEHPPLDVTANGLAAMQRELEALQQEVPRLIEAIALAREDKDFRENAPLDAAREAMAQNEARRKQLESDLRRARVADTASAHRVSVGSRVSVTRLDSGQQFSYTLVGAREANAREGKISVESPVGRELLGKVPGDEIAVRTPNGEIVFRLDDIQGS